MDALHETVGPGAACYPFLIIFFITLLGFNLFIAVISYSFNQIQRDLEPSDPNQSEKDSSGNTGGRMQEEQGGERFDEAKDGTEDNTAEDLITQSNKLHAHYQTRLARTSDYHQRLTRASDLPLSQLSEPKSSRQHLVNTPDPAKQAGKCSAWSSLPEVGKGAGVAIKSAFDSTTRRQMRMQAKLSWPCFC